MNANEKLISAFYQAFAQRDWKGMQACYHEDVVFSDPAFRELKGKRAKAMWHMLAESARDFSLTFNHVTATDSIGGCQWQASYRFSKTNRKVLNNISANFAFKEGKIIRHTDRFDLWKWSRMALGLPGIILGWSGLIQGKIRSTANQSLDKFIQNHPEYAN